MQYQKVVDREYAVYKIQSHNQSQLEAIRQRNQARLNSDNASEENITLSAAPDAPTLDPVEREAALNRTVVRNIAPTIQPKVIQNSYTPSVVNYTATPTTERAVGNVDMRKVEQAWQGWVNELRASEGLAPYAINEKLNLTAQEWSEFSRDRGYTTHGRPGDGCVGATNYGCYNFSAIDDWFKARGVDATVVNRAKHTENVGFGTFRCTSGDCTNAAIQAIRSTYNFFYSEKSYNGAHYRSMVQPNFTNMGLGLAFDGSKYYLTIHYATDLK